MNQKINQIHLNKAKNLKTNSFKSKSPRIKSNLIYNIINKSNNIVNNKSQIINNNHIKIKLDNIIFLINNYQPKTAKANSESNKQSLNNGINYNKDIKDIINNQTKYKINEINNERIETPCGHINLEEEKPEDITDYLNIKENKKYINYNYNDVIEEVEEAKEMSELKQPSEIKNNIPNLEKPKLIIKNFDFNIIETNYLKNKFNKINLKKKFNKKILNKRLSKIINFSPPRRKNAIVSQKHENSYFNIKKNNLNLSNIYIKTDNNIENRLISQNKYDLIESKGIKSNPIINEKNNIGGQKNQIKIMNIKQRNNNNGDFAKNNNINNKSDIIMKTNNEMKKVVKTESNEISFIDNKSYSKTNRNKKIIIDNKILDKINKSTTNIQPKSYPNGIKNIKIQIINQKKGINYHKKIFKPNKNEKIVISDEEKKLNKTSIIDNNNNSSNYQYLSYEKVKSKIRKIKISKEKYQKIFIDHCSNKAKIKKGKIIKNIMINNRKNLIKNVKDEITTNNKLEH